MDLSLVSVFIHSVCCHTYTINRPFKPQTLFFTVLEAGKFKITMPTEQRVSENSHSEDHMLLNCVLTY